MYIIEISPISNSLPSAFDRVSFYGKNFLEVGSVVPITFNNRSMHGIVVSSVHVREMKQLIKTSHFTMKKLDIVDTDIILPNPLSACIMNIAEQNLQSPGRMWAFLLGEEISPDRLVDPLPEGGSAIAVGTGSITAHELPLGESLEKIKINNPDIVLCPTISYVEYIRKHLPDLTVLPIQEFLKYILDHGITHLSHTDREKTSVSMTIAVLNISDTRYIHREPAPYIDYRTILQPATHIISAHIDLYDTYIDNHVARIYNLDTSDIIMTSNTPQNLYLYTHDKTTRFGESMFCTEVYNEIKKVVYEGGLVNIITGRKGLASSISCSNCAYIAKCPVCSHIQSLTVAKRTGERVFHCTHCSAKSPVYDTCPLCQGLMSPLGYTTESIATSINELFPEISTVVIDSDTVKNWKQLQKKLITVENGGVIITTPALYDYLPICSLSVIVSLDGLLCAPYYDQDSIVYRLLRKISQQTERVLIQTKSGAMDSQFVSTSDAWRAYTDQISQQYHLPPASTHLTLTKVIYSNALHDEVSTMKEFIKNTPLLQYVNTVSRPSRKKSHILVQHILQCDTNHASELYKNILPSLAGYTIRKV